MQRMMAMDPGVTAMVDWLTLPIIAVHTGLVLSHGLGGRGHGS